MNSTTLEALKNYLNYFIYLILVLTLLLFFLYNLFMRGGEPKDCPFRTVFGRRGKGYLYTYNI